MSVIDQTFNYYAKQIIQNADCWTETTKPRTEWQVLNGNPWKGTEKPRRVVNGLALVPGTADDPGPWNPRSVLFLEKVFPQLEEEAALDTEDHPSGEITKTYLRTRRSAGVVIAFAITNLFALGSTGYTQLQLDRITRATRALAGEQSLIVKKFNKANTEIVKNRDLALSNQKRIDAIERLGQRPNAQVAISYISQVANRILRTAHQTIELYANTVADALDGRLHFGLIQAEEAQRILLQTKKIAASRGLLPATDSVSHLHSLPVSVRFHSDGFDLIIHVPLVPIHSLFSLYQHNPFPLNLNGSGVMMTVEGEHDIIAINNNEENPMYFEISESHLARFTKLGNTYIATGINIINKHNKPSCLFALHQNQQREALDLCHIYVTPAKTALVKISSHELLSYSQEHGIYKHLCFTGNRPMWRTPRQLSTIQKVTLKNGCLTFFSDMIAFPDSSFDDTDENIEPYQWNVDPLKTLKGLSADAIKVAIAATTMAHRRKIEINEIRAKYAQLQDEERRGKLFEEQLNGQFDRQQRIVHQLQRIDDIAASLGGNHTALGDAVETLTGLMQANLTSVHEGIAGMAETFRDTIKGTTKYIDQKAKNLRQYWNEFKGNPVDKVEGILADQAGIAAKQVMHSNWFIALTVAGCIGLIIMLGSCYCNYNRSRPVWFKDRFDEMCNTFDRRPSQLQQQQEMRDLREIYQREIRNHLNNKNPNAPADPEENHPLYPQLPNKPHPNQLQTPDQ